MDKLKLRIDNLEVESFQTQDTGEGRRGTVRAASEIIPASDGPFVCFGTEITGPCCDVTLAPSCIETNCITECLYVTEDACLPEGGTPQAPIPHPEPGRRDP